MSEPRRDDPVRGHRTLPHTADVIVEAWGPDRAACLEELVLGTVATFAAVPPEGGSTRTSRPVIVDAPLDEELVVQLLDEVLYLVEVRGVVPVGVDLDDAEDGSVAGFLEVVPVAHVEQVGALPKGCSRSGLVAGPDPAGWRCRVVVDV